LTLLLLLLLRLLTASSFLHTNCLRFTLTASARQQLYADY
jgi:hypothetical protein